LNIAATIVVFQHENQLLSLQQATTLSAEMYPLSLA
jgi:hypothetical protein